VKEESGMADVRPGAASTHQGEANEVSLAEYLLFVWRHRVLLLVVMLSAATISLGVGWSRPPVFEAQARLMVVPPRPGTQARTVNVSTYQALAGSSDLIHQTLVELGFDKPPHNFTASTLLAGNIEVAPVRDSNVIQLAARFNEPELAARFVARWAEKAVESAHRLLYDDVGTARDAIKAQVDAARERVERAEKALESFRTTSRLEVIEKEVDALLAQRARLLLLNAQIEAERARIAQAIAELEKKPALSGERPVPPGAGGDQTGRGEPAETVPRTSSDPWRDPAAGNRASLEHALSLSRMNLKALERERDQIVKATDLSGAAGRKLSQLHARRNKGERLRAEATQARNAYRDISLRYEQALAQAAALTPQLQVLDPPLTPTRPVSPRIARDTIAAVGVAWLATCAGLMLSLAVRKVRGGSR
jgi:uncharacterized protein involved in exopolysaccharide biosynthesis